MKGYQKIAIAFNGGTSEHWNNSDKVGCHHLIHCVD
jgi:hypothetical protein